MPWRDKDLLTFLTSNTTWKCYCEVFRKMIFKTVSGSDTIVSRSAQLHKESSAKATAAASAHISKFCSHRAIPRIKLSHLILVMCVISHLVSRVIWSCINALILGSDHALGYIHSGTRVIWRYINACILESNHTLVKCVINHSGIRFIWEYNNAHVLESDRTSVMCVIRHSQSRVLWRYTSANILGSSSTTFMMFVVSHSHWRVLWRYLSARILGSHHTPVMCVMNH
jgi:hypothetical protein